MKALVTGFDAFGGATANPSAEIAARLSRTSPPPPVDTLESLLLPTVYTEAARRMCNALATGRPDLIVMFGLAARTDCFRLERFAVNVADCPDPDNAGSVLEGQSIVGDGPAAYRTALDVGAIAARCGELGPHRPAVSNHAGSFVCNFAYFSVLHEIATTGARTAAVFVHVPWSLPVDDPVDLVRSPLDRHVDTARTLLTAIAESLPRNDSAA